MKRLTPQSVTDGQTVNAIDTNVLVRYITADDDSQFTQAVTLIESGEPKLVNPIVLVELSWVLRSVYGLERETIADTLRMISSCGYFLYKRPRPIKAAIECYVAGYDLADALILSTNTDDGAAATYTFDKKAGKLQGYELLQ